VIDVKTDHDCLQVTIPTAGLTPDQINEFVAWLRVESVLRRSRLTPEAARELSEQIKSGCWQANEHRFAAKGETE